MTATGHVLIGDEGELIGMDAAFCDILRMTPEHAHGRLVLDVTAPADREECDVAIRKLRETGRPFSITKRFLRDDGSLVWVTNTVSITTTHDGIATIMATIEPVDAPAERTPATLLSKAHGLIKARRDRVMVCDPVFFSDAAWDAVLVAYVAEAEGRSIDLDGFGEALGIRKSIVALWIKALLHHDVLQVEYRNPDAEAPKAYHLTASTHRKLEEYLARISFPG